MSEGGYFPWRRQSIRGNPACDYSNLSSPLPNLPKGHVWVRNPETREWIVAATPELGLVEATTVHAAVGVPLDIDMGKDMDMDGCDYLQHSIQPTDTFQGVCLRYCIDAVSLRQANKFSGSNLLFAPETLLIPLVRKAYDKNNEKKNNNSTSINRSINLQKEDNIREFLLTFRGSGGQKQASSTNVSRKEAVAYLDMNDGNLQMAIQDAKDDFGWELEEAQNEPEFVTETSTLL